MIRGKDTAPRHDPLWAMDPPPVTDVELSATNDKHLYIVDAGVGAVIHQIIHGYAGCEYPDVLIRSIAHLQRLEQTHPELVADAWHAADIGDWQAYKDKYRFRPPDDEQHRRIYPEWYRPPEPEPPPTLF